MKKLAWMMLAIAALPFSVQAQKTASDSHMKAIMDHVDSRIGGQTDIWFKDGFFPACINLLRFSYEEDPTDYETATNLGWMLENVHQYDQALAIYVRYRKDNPALPDSAFPEADFYFREKAYSKVPPLLQPTIEKKPFMNSYRDLAHAYERLGLYPDALKVWQKLVSDYPKDAAAKVNLDKVQKKIGQPASG